MKDIRLLRTVGGICNPFTAFVRPCAYNNRKVSRNAWRRRRPASLALAAAMAVLAALSPAMALPARADAVAETIVSAGAEAGSGAETIVSSGAPSNAGALSNAGARLPSGSFVYRYLAELEARAEEFERARQEAIEARRVAEEAREREAMVNRVAILTEEEIDSLFTEAFFTQRLKDLGFYKETGGDASLLYRDSVIRLQAAKNMNVDAILGRVSKLALLEDSPLSPVDEVASAASNGYWITINKSYNILTVYEGSKVHKKYPVATGRRPSLTPEGKFTIVTKSVNPSWGGGGYAKPVAGGSPSNPLGKRWLGLNIGGGGKYGVHGNAAPRSIGTYASAGCVRMINSDVEEMYAYIPIGTPVWIGTSQKLKDLGVQQYFMVETPPEAQAASADGADGAGGAGGADSAGRGAGGVGGAGTQNGDGLPQVPQAPTAQEQGKAELIGSFGQANDQAPAKSPTQQQPQEL